MSLCLLFPTDFSESANHALEYALKMLEKAEGHLVFYHAYHLPTVDSTMDNLMLARMEEDARQTAYTQLLRYAQQSADRQQRRTGVDLSYTVDVSPGYATEGLPEAIYRHKVDYVVLGTKGATGLEKNLLGSNAADAVEKLSVPLLIVPEGGRYHALKRIVYATDGSTEDMEYIGALLEFARIFDSQIHFVHFDPKGDTQKLAQYQHKIAPLIEHLPTHFETVKGRMPEDDLLHYTEKIQADVVALFHRDRHFLARLFHRSVTKKMAFHSKIPVLSFKGRRE